jgi:hypothetical protein
MLAAPAGDSRRTARHLRLKVCRRTVFAVCSSIEPVQVILLAMISMNMPELRNRAQ